MNSLGQNGLRTVRSFYPSHCRLTGSSLPQYQAIAVALRALNRYLKSPIVFSKLDSVAAASCRAILGRLFTAETLQRRLLEVLAADPHGSLISRRCRPQGDEYS